MYVAFTDSREAKNAIGKVCLLRPEWHAVPITCREYVQHSEPAVLHQTSDFEGQLSVSVYYDSHNPSLNQGTVALSLETLAVTFGDIRSFKVLPSRQGNVSEFLIEFFDTRDAENAMTTLNGTSMDNCILEVTLFRPDMACPRRMYPSQTPLPENEAHSRTEPLYRRRVDSSPPSRPARSSYMELSPTGRSMIPSGERASIMNWISMAGNRFSSSSRGELDHYSDLGANNQNSVDVERVRLGLDVRTTVCPLTSILLDFALTSHEDHASQHPEQNRPGRCVRESYDSGSFLTCSSTAYAEDHRGRNKPWQIRFHVSAHR